MVSSIAISHNLTLIICLHTVCSIWPIDRTLSGATTLGQSGTIAMKGYSTVPKSPRLAIRLFTVISKILGGGGGGVLFLCRHAVGVFYSPSKLGWVMKEYFTLLSSRREPHNQMQFTVILKKPFLERGFSGDTISIFIYIYIYIYISYADNARLSTKILWLVACAMNMAGFFNFPCQIKRYH